MVRKLLILFLFSLPVIFCKACEDDPVVPVEFKEAIGIISTTRNEAEDRVLKVKRDCENGEINREQFEKASERYGYARTAFNGWINEVEAGLISDDFEQSVEESEQLQQAVAAEMHFRNYVENEYAQVETFALSPAVTAVLPLVGPLVNSAVEMWKIHLEAKSEERALMREMLEEQEWESFSALGERDYQLNCRSIEAVQPPPIPARDQLKLLFGGDSTIGMAILAAADWSRVMGNVSAELVFEDLESGPANLEGRARDVDRCKEFMAEAGYPNGYYGLPLMIVSDDESMTYLAIELQAFFVDCGLESDIEILDSYDEAYQKLMQRAIAGEPSLLISY